MAESSGQSVANSKVDGDLVKIVLQDDETVIHLGSVTENRLEGSHLLSGADNTTSDFPVCEM